MTSAASWRDLGDQHEDVPLPAWCTDGYRADKWIFDKATGQHRRGIDGPSQKHGPLELALSAWQEADGVVSSAEIYIHAGGNLFARADSASAPSLADDLRAAADELDSLSIAAASIVDGEPRKA